MWIRKAKRDAQKGVDSPVPAQLVSNGEFIPRRQTTQQKQVEYLSHGARYLFLASNRVFGNNFDVDEKEMPPGPEKLGPGNP